MFFFFNDTATTEIYTLSLHDALPILINGGKNNGMEKDDGGFRNCGNGGKRAGATYAGDCAQGVLENGRFGAEQHRSASESRLDRLLRFGIRCVADEGQQGGGEP